MPNIRQSTDTILPDRLPPLRQNSGFILLMVDHYHIHQEVYPLQDIKPEGKFIEALFLEIEIEIDDDASNVDDNKKCTGDLHEQFLIFGMEHVIAN